MQGLAMIILPSPSWTITKLEEEATEDIYRLAKVSDTDLEPEIGIIEQLKGRLPWLFLSAITVLFASWVISQFEEAIAEVAVLAIFLTVVAALGGNAVAQNMAMVVRSIALGKITPRCMNRRLHGARIRSEDQPKKAPNCPS